VQSYAHIRGEWEQRKPSLFGAVKSFISQLRAGQDLTRVSLPCVFLRPYSLLEEVAARNISHLDILFNVEEEKDPVMRMLGLCRWLVSTAKQEEYRHKPYNPVIGEVHRCKFAHDPDEPLNTTYLILEQVEHHPPTCGIRLDNPYHKVVIEGFYTFQVVMYKNSVAATNNGSVYIQVGDERYDMPKAMPDLMIRNLFVGTKLVVWEGTILLSCKQTGITGAFELAAKGRTNVVTGKVTDTNLSADAPIVFCEGKCGGPVVWHYNSAHPKFKEQMEDGSKDKKEKKEAKKELEKEMELADDAETRKVLLPTYPKSQEDNSSIKIWKPVSKCIIDNDMDTGDLEKKKIEDKQRALFLGLKDKGEDWKPVYFDFDKDNKTWKIKDKEWWKEYKD